MKKKTLAYMLSVAMALTVWAAPAQVLADTAGTEEGPSNVGSESDMAVEEESTATEDTEEQEIKKMKLTCVMKSTTSVKVSWKKVSGADGYRIYRKTGNDGDTKRIKTFGSSKTNFTNKGLKSGKNHFYTIEAYEKDTEGNKVVTGASDTVKVFTPKKLTQSTKGFKNTNAGKIISVAKTKLGCAYVSGGSGPNVFDCSGFVYWVYKKAGVAGAAVKRTSAAGLYSSLKKHAVSRSLSKAQPGDIVLFGSGGGIRHAAIYYGNDKLIHASTGSTGVCITGTSWSGGQSGVVAILRLPNLR